MGSIVKVIGSALPAVGTAVGTVFGGPVGAAIGGAAGTFLGGKLQGGGGGGASGIQQPGVMQSAFGSTPQLYSKNPNWLNSAAQGNANAAVNAAAIPYQAYGGQLVAPRSNNQMLAATQAQTQIGRYQPAYDNMNNNFQQASQANTNRYTPGSVGYNNVTTSTNPQAISAPQQWNTATANQYMNPYLQASLAPQIQQLNQNYATQQNDANARAAGSGNFGGSRQAVENALINKQHNTDLQNVEANGYNTAYNTALGASQNANQQQLASQQAQAGIYAQDAAQNLQGQLANQQAGINTGEFNQNQNANAFQMNQNIIQQNKANDLAAAAGLNNMVNTKANIANQDINNLQSTGATAQNTNQAQDTAKYQQFLQQRGYPMEQAAALAAILSQNASRGSIGNGQDVVANNGLSDLGGQVGTAFNNAGGINGITTGIKNFFGGGSGNVPTANIMDGTNVLPSFLTGNGSTTDMWGNPNVSNAISNLAF